MHRSNEEVHFFKIRTYELIPNVDMFIFPIYSFFFFFFKINFSIDI